MEVGVVPIMVLCFRFTTRMVITTVLTAGEIGVMVMIEIKALKCPYCGGNIDRKTMRCSFCGTEYMIRDNNIVRIETYSAPIQDIRSQMHITNEDLRLMQNDPGFMEFCIKRLATELAVNLFPAMQIHVSDDRYSNSKIIQGRIKAVVPRNQFTGDLEEWSGF